MKIKIFTLLISLAVLQNITAQVKAEHAETILQCAYAEAGKTNKNVFVIFHASWCGWCHKLDNSIADTCCRKYFADNYVICHLTVLESDDKKKDENPGAQSFLKEHNGDGAGLPFFLILDKHGALLADSKNAGSKDNGNIGCPAKEDEIEYFISILKRTSKLKKDQLAVIEKRFAKNAL